MKKLSPIYLAGFDSALSKAVRRIAVKVVDEMIGTFEPSFLTGKRLGKIVGSYDASITIELGNTTLKKMVDEFIRVTAEDEIDCIEDRERLAALFEAQAKRLRKHA